MSSLDDDDVKLAVINLVVKCGTIVPVKKEYAMESRLIATSLETDFTATEIPLYQISKTTLADIIEFLDHYATIGVALPDPKSQTVLKDDEWCSNWIEKIYVTGKHGAGRLHSLTFAANYLDIPSLLNVCTTKFATLGQNKSIVDILQMLKIPA